MKNKYKNRSLPGYLDFEEVKEYSDHIRHCPCCGERFPFTFICFNCAVLECKCGMSIKNGAATVCYRFEDVPKELEPYVGPATGLIMIGKDDEEKKFHKHGYYTLSCIIAFDHAGFLEKWNRRVAR